MLPSVSSGSRLGWKGVLFVLTMEGTHSSAALECGTVSTINTSCGTVRTSCGTVSTSCATLLCR